MSYSVKTIKSKEEITSCQVFEITHYPWGGPYRPKTTGQMGFIPDEGFYLTMTCMEEEPQCMCLDPNDPVYLDSAMEAFFQFYESDHNDIYMNFEMNAIGTLLAEYGNVKLNRNSLPLSLHKLCNCNAAIEEECWSVEIMIPLQAIEHVYGRKDFKSGDRFRCNFYKVKETPDLIHYGCYVPVDSKLPNFHLTQFFAEAIIE